MVTATITKAASARIRIWVENMHETPPAVNMESGTTRQGLIAVDHPRGGCDPSSCSVLHRSGLPRSSLARISDGFLWGREPSLLWGQATGSGRLPYSGTLLRQACPPKVDTKGYAPSVNPDAWRWISYQDRYWTWPVQEIGDDYFDDEEALDKAVFAVAVRASLRSLRDAFPERLLLRLVNELRQAVEDVQADIVAEARTQGVSWTRIGRSLDVGRTAAQKRYGRGLPPEREDQLELETQAAIEWVTDDLGDETPDEVEAEREFLALITERRGST